MHRLVADYLKKYLISKVKNFVIFLYIIPLIEISSELYQMFKPKIIFQYLLINLPNLIYRFNIYSHTVVGILIIGIKCEYPYPN